MRRVSLTRRGFIKIAALTSAAVIGGKVASRMSIFDTASPLRPEHLHEARYWRALDRKAVQCQLCFRNCPIPEGGRGYCSVRENRDGVLFSLVYGRAAGTQVDPVELEPIYHMLPGHRNLALYTAGCNFMCSFCHNWHVATKRPEEIDAVALSPLEVVELAVERNCQSISCTINEPTVFYEYMVDVAQRAQQEGLRTLFHTNGAINPEPLRALLSHMDAVCVDLKAFTADFYEQTSFSELKPVLTALQIMKEEGVWFEITNLIIPTLNDDLEGIGEMAVWIREELGTDVPVHFSRFFPAYKLTRLPPTPIETLEGAAEIASQAGLEYVTIGNVPGHEANSTFCPQCGQLLIERVHYQVISNRMADGTCPSCGHQIPGIWD